MQAQQRQVRSTQRPEASSREFPVVSVSGKRASWSFFIECLIYSFINVFQIWLYSTIYSDGCWKNFACASKKKAKASNPIIYQVQTRDEKCSALLKAFVFSKTNLFPLVLFFTSFLQKLKTFDSNRLTTFTILSKNFSSQRIQLGGTGEAARLTIHMVHEDDVTPHAGWNHVGNSSSSRQEQLWLWAKREVRHFARKSIANKSFQRTPHKCVCLQSDCVSCVNK